MHLWDTADGSEVGCYYFGTSACVAVAVSPDGMTAAVGGHGPNSLVVWDIE